MHIILVSTRFDGNETNVAYVVANLLDIYTQRVQHIVYYYYYYYYYYINIKEIVI